MPGTDRFLLLVRTVLFILFYFSADAQPTNGSQSVSKRSKSEWFPYDYDMCEVIRKL